MVDQRKSGAIGRHNQAGGGVLFTIPSKTKGAIILIHD